MLPLELINSIVDELGSQIHDVDSLTALKQCARSSRSFSVRARRYIFANVTVERDRPPERPVDTFIIREILQSLSSPHVITLSIMGFMGGSMVYGLVFFLPSIVLQLGFSAAKTQLLSAGPSAAGFFVTLISAYWSDHHNSRGIPMAIILTLAIAGYALFLGATDKYTAYGALFLIIPGVFAPAPIVSAWMANNSVPHYRRATSITMSFIVTNCGGILAMWRYPTREGPKFQNTMIMNLIFTVLIIVGSFINMFYLSRSNKRKQNVGYRAKVLAKFQDTNGDDELKAWMELGDRHPDFRYTL